MSTSNRSGWPEDLSVRARRGGLSDTERRELEQELRTSAALQLSHQVGRDFDAISSMRAGDEALVLRALTATMQLEPLRRRRLRLTRAFGLAALLAVGAAAALTSSTHGPATRAASPAVLTKSVGLRSFVERPLVRAEDESSQLESAALPPAASPTASPGHAAAKRAPSATSGSPRVPAEPDALPDAVAEETAADLFRRAGSARSAGDMARAHALFQTLQNRFPRSEEARLSHVSLGKLLLAGGNAREAELQFARYLASGSGSLMEEAWVGRADSLRQLGRSADERQNWMAFLERYPRSVYAPRARQRLSQLGAADR